MTNISVIVTVWMNLVTNPAPVGYTTNGAAFYQVSTVSTINHYLADGSYLNCSTMNFHSFVTNNPPAARTPVPPRLRPRPGPGPRTDIIAPHQFAQLANGGRNDTDQFVLMFKTNFNTSTNNIYGLQATSDWKTWTDCPPPIDGTGQVEWFFDALTNSNRYYRIVATAGVLP